MPDEELIAKAADGSLIEPSILRGEVERMLSDSKAAAFIENFTGQWLHLRKLGEMPPDPEQNPAYYAEDLEAAMKTETHLFFGDLLAEDKSLLNLIDSDCTFLNRALAKHYGIPGVEGDFRRVSLKP